MNLSKIGNTVFLPAGGDEPRDLPVLLYGLGYDIVKGGEYRFDNKSLSRWHKGEVFQLSLAGCGAFREEGKSRPVPEGSVFLASADRPFQYEYPGGDPWEFIYLTFLGPAAVSLFARWREKEGSILRLGHPDALIKRIRELHEQPLSAGEYRSNSRTAYELLMLIDAAVEDCAPSPTVRQQTEGMIRRDLSGISVEALAAHWGYEPHYFITWLRSSTGITPGRLIREIRMDTAAEYLIHSPRSIALVAEACGFDDPGLFSRRFKAHHGCSPREFRRRRRAPVRSTPVFLTGDTTGNTAGETT